jgi:hypothetical protein
MTAAQLVHFAIVIGLGILAFLTFLVAGTILALMIVEDIGCHYCVDYPVGLFVLGFLGLLLLISAVRELIEGPYFTWDWITARQEGLILALLILLVLIIIL